MGAQMRKILIANRGEIAVRIIRTARRMGIATVAVYSEADQDALFAEMADEAVAIGPAPARESYLDQAKIIAAAKASGADAIHPGYGFLSENADFVAACQDTGILFIGPPASAIAAMGLKGAAKALMQEAGVPVVPGYHGDDQDDAKLASEAAHIGYPVLIKAVAGGGGKGMRRVDDAADFADALASARREAASAFGNDKVLVEKYVAKPRHIEIQVFADGHGHAVHLFERDCSLQRRHQKVIEEAPAPAMPAAMRAAMGDAAVKAALAIGYQGAGTVEFIADASNGLTADGFYFMEMNTRLQVEHPVTEAITGVDLVEWQIRVARGETLPRRQDDLTIQGHAIEARLYAEDPDNGFLPSTGSLRRLTLDDSQIRVDSGVRTGDAISIHYDPMIAKLIAHGPDRQTAIARLIAALDNSAVIGIASNRHFLRRALAHPAFQAGDIDTGFIARHGADLLIDKSAAPDPTLVLLAALGRLLDRAARAASAAAGSPEPNSPWHRRDGWRLNLPAKEYLRFDGDIDVEVRAEGDGWWLRWGEAPAQLARGRLDPDGRLLAQLGARRLSAQILFDGESIDIASAGQRLRLVKAVTHVEDDSGAEQAASLSAPMPGKILSVDAAAGDTVQRGARLLVMEAMKMELTITAPADSVVEQIAVTVGDQVAEGALLVRFQSEDEA